MPRINKLDKKYMELALSLAERGVGKTSPNPAVGALLVKKGRIIAADYHKKAGTPHAEALVIKKAGISAKGATLYCTLETCTHYGKTPPCVDAVIKSGIKRAVFAMKDPNPVNDGKGIERLKKSGIEVKYGLLEDRAKKLNRPFIKFMKKRLPYVTLKIAESIDGKIADSYGNSKWVTSLESRRLTHRMRAEHDAVMVGINTLLRDDPLLNNRYCRDIKRQPVRIVLDTMLRTPLKSRLLKGGKDCGHVLIAGGIGASLKRKELLENKGAKVVLLPKEKDRIKLMSLLKYLADKGIMSVLCEGGGELAASLIKERLADEAYFFLSPKIIGGRTSPTACDGPDASLKDSVTFKNIMIKRVGPDIMIHGEFRCFQA
jgi:diaminohydroxyphosphoribosylaminopyrimidine deaminase/5-amino-6-(5-phosphoribosylamino)uracil reductase